MRRNDIDADIAFEPAPECSLSFGDLFQRQYNVALRRSTSCQRGEVQQILQKKLDQLPDTDASACCSAQVGTIQGTASDDVGAQSMRGPLADLLEHIAQHPTLRMATVDTDAMDSYPELVALEDFRTICTRIRLQGQIRRTLQPAPIDAGPLNSGTLVHRSLTLMRKVSPDYLLQFLSYLDTLAWMEQISGDIPGPAKLTPNSKRSRKRGRGKPCTPL